jgi:competence protein ComEA
VTLVVLLLAGAGWDLARVAHSARNPGNVPLVAVPSPAPGADSTGGGSSEARAPAPEAHETPIDLNRAGPAELESLPGIGPVLARRICEQRAQEGPFRSVEELRAVRGIGPRLLERLKGKVTAGQRP